MSAVIFVTLVTTVTVTLWHWKGGGGCVDAVVFLSFTESWMIVTVVTVVIPGTSTRLVRARSPFGDTRPASLDARSRISGFFVVTGSTEAYGADAAITCAGYPPCVFSESFRKNSEG